MVIIIALLAALGMRGGEHSSDCARYIPQTMEQSQIMRSESQL